jgi:4-amino-4-deoxy-L-arabinose transferase-like glycosyltransferase
MSVAEQQPGTFAAWPRLLRAWLDLAERVTNALLDPRRRDKTVIALLIAFAGVWALYSILSRGSRDIYFDIGEIIGWSHRPSLAYHHPPMSVWVGQAWFSVFPVEDWSAYLLATVWIALTLWISWRLFSEWLDDTKRVFALAMLTLIPLHTFHASLFNANAVQMVFWSAATLFFLRAFRTHQPLPSILVGVAAGGAFLGKYWAVFLIAGFIIAALLDRRRAAYFRSSSPWISAGVGLLVIAPHLIWLIAVDPITISFANTTSQMPSSLRMRSLSYFGELLGYISAAMLAFFALRPRWTALVDVATPRDADRRLVATLLVVPLLLPPLVCLFAPYRLTGLWTIPNWTLLPVVLLGSQYIRVTREAVVWMVAVALAIPLVVTLAAPGVALVSHYQHMGKSQPHYRALAQNMERVWKSTTQRPLRLAGGDFDVVNGVLFYLPGDATALEGHLLDAAAGRVEIKLTGDDGARLARDGIVLVCKNTEAYCLAAMDKAAGAIGGRRQEIELRRSYLGILGKPDRYTIMAVPPKP